MIEPRQLRTRGLTGRRACSPARWRALRILLAALAVAGSPGLAAAQSLYLDVNGDGRGDADDVLNPAVSSVDVYLDTTRDGGGAAALCTDKEPLSICSYTLILEWEPVAGSSVAYGAWSDNMGFTVPAGGARSGRMFWIGRAAPFFLAPGRYLLGSLEVKVTGTPVLRFLSSTDADKTAITSFGSQCGGHDFDNTLKLGSDFLDARGTARGSDTPRTVWGTIRELYR
jgi:hypothetical protein